MANVRQVLGLAGGAVGGGGGVRIEAIGRPRTKGSLKPIHTKLGNGRCKVVLTESGEYSAAWKREVIRAIRAQCEVTRYAAAVVVDRSFRFERLCVPDETLPWPTRVSGEWAHGDSDKLSRLVLDSLTQSGLLADDSNVVGGVEGKRWCRPGEPAGVIVKVRPATPADLAALLLAEEA